MDLANSDRIQQPTDFLDLPAEIRLAIYQLLIEDEVRDEELHFNKAVVRLPIEPAIAQVCRTTRKEALDFWFSTARFPIHFRALEGHKGEYSIVNQLVPIPYADARKLELSFAQTYGMNSLYYLYSVDLNERTNSYTVEHAPRTNEWWVGYRPWNIIAHAMAERRARSLLKHFDRAVEEMIASSGGVKELTAESYQMLTPRPWWQLGEGSSGEDELLRSGNEEATVA
ncbi:uncharacterized protein LTR77_001353 [Saxophila tyrrhenica]|uniref:Uncharacterized protein n=1 Tax=Saxophila tyrrhenica TaxID=1690608 RepID=A0AAV9PJV4_9PEZI|nr:hypothetical protein LTR77_001353 [Saxophila tyrrhenica]